MLPKSINLILLQLTSAVSQPDPAAILPAEGNRGTAASVVKRPKQEGWFHPISLPTPSITAPISGHLLLISISYHSPATHLEEKDVHVTFSCYFLLLILGYLGDLFINMSFDHDKD